VDRTVRAHGQRANGPCCRSIRSAGCRPPSGCPAVASPRSRVAPPEAGQVGVHPLQPFKVIGIGPSDQERIRGEPLSLGRSGGDPAAEHVRDAHAGESFVGLVIHRPARSRASAIETLACTRPAPERRQLPGIVLVEPGQAEPSRLRSRCRGSTRRRRDAADRPRPRGRRRSSRRRGASRSSSTVRSAPPPTVTRAAAGASYPRNRCGSAHGPAASHIRPCATPRRRRSRTGSGQHQVDDTLGDPGAP